MSGPVAHVDDLEAIYSRLEKRQLPQYPISLSERILSNGQNSQHVESNICNMVELVLPNKDRYSGSLLDSLPEGFGKYIWSDGCIYEGEWKRGMTNGRGRITWHSGAIYEGEFAGGYIDGNGMYTAPDKVTYKGGWRLNVKHGSGRKFFSNGDVFEGSWIEGMIEGPGKYIWANGNVYIGNMKGGKMSGKGVMTWTNGDSFEGHWVGGMMHGFGVYTWADGGCYVGTWSRGLKDGKGAFYPKGGKLPAVQELYLRALRKGGLIPNLIKQDHNPQISHASTVDMGKLKFPKPPKPIRGSSTILPNGVLRSSGQAHRRNVSLERRWSLEVALEKIIGHDAATVAEPIVEDNEEDVDTNVPILEREYMQGVLISELVINNSLSQLSRSAKRRQKKLEKGLKRPGETIIKGHRSYDLMLNLQLGIRYTVGKITPIQRREVRASDFGPRACFWMNFPREGSQLTPPHRSVDFKWKDYCPMVFRNLREMFKIDAADYMISVCGSAALRELSSPGKSGSVFFLSQDDRFMIKTLRKSEVQVLLQMLPNYHHHVQTYENTLITKFFGLHRIKAGGQKFRFVVMGNMFCTELRIHRRFDLKGSSQGRCTNKIEIDENTTLKDLDLNYQFYLEPSWREALLKQIEIDCKFLEQQRIMDYSLLLGVHFRAPQYLQPAITERQPVAPGASSKPAEDYSLLLGVHFRAPQYLQPAITERQPVAPGASSKLTEDDEISSYPQGLVLVARGPYQNGVVVGPHIRGSRLRASAAGDEEVDLLLPGTARLQIQLGVNMPARAEHISKEGKSDLFHDVYDVVLYLGIIDILQDYNMRKKIEHACKSLQFDSFSISVVEPSLYSHRFLQFIQHVFPKNS